MEVIANRFRPWPLPVLSLAYAKDLLQSVLMDALMHFSRNSKGS
jgi:hypothetical protein